MWIRPDICQGQQGKLIYLEVRNSKIVNKHATSECFIFSIKDFALPPPHKQIITSFFWLTSAKYLPETSLWFTAGFISSCVCVCVAEEWLNGYGWWQTFLKPPTALSRWYEMWHRFEWTLVETYLSVCVFVSKKTNIQEWHKCERVWNKTPTSPCPHC